MLRRPEGPAAPMRACPLTRLDGSCPANPREKKAARRAGRACPPQCRTAKRAVHHADRRSGVGARDRSALREDPLGLRPEPGEGESPAPPGAAPRSTVRARSKGHDGFVDHTAPGTGLCETMFDPLAGIGFIDKPDHRGLKRPARLGCHAVDLRDRLQPTDMRTQHDTLLIQNKKRCVDRQGDPRPNQPDEIADPCQPPPHANSCFACLENSRLAL